MNKILPAIFLVLPVFFIFSCQSKGFNKKLILEKDTLDFSYKIYQTRQKTNADNEAQCAKYFEYNRSNDAYEIRGADVKHLVSFLLGTPKKNIQVSRNIDDWFYEVLFQGKDDSISKKIILNDFFAYTELKLKNDLQEVEGYELSVNYKEDKNPQKKSNRARVEVTNGQYILTNPDLKILAITLRDLYSREFVAESDFPIEDMRLDADAELKTNLKFLQDHHGIHAKKIKKEIVKYTITQDSN